MAKNDDRKLFAFLGVFLTIVGFIIVYAARKKDAYSMYYAKQGLVLFIGWVIAALIGLIPIVGQVLAIILYIGLFVLWIIGIVYSLSGREKSIPIVSVYADMIKIK